MLICLPIAVLLTLLPCIKSQDGFYGRFGGDDSFDDYYRGRGFDGPGFYGDFGDRESLGYRGYGRDIDDDGFYGRSSGYRDFFGGGLRPRYMGYGDGDDGGRSLGYRGLYRGGYSPYDLDDDNDDFGGLFRGNGGFGGYRGYRRNRRHRRRIARRLRRYLRGSYVPNRFYRRRRFYRPKYPRFGYRGYPGRRDFDCLMCRYCRATFEHIKDIGSHCVEEHMAGNYPKCESLFKGIIVK